MSIRGYARISTGDPDRAGQKRRLQAAGAYRVFEDVISGKTFERTGLADVFDHLRPGDTPGRGPPGQAGAFAP
jgi:DNA invertase Pin-like site-specific DNA recombinase